MDEPGGHTPASQPAVVVAKPSSLSLSSLLLLLLWLWLLLVGEW